MQTSGRGGRLYGPLSDRIGRKPVILFNMVGALCGLVLRFVAGYVTRDYMMFLASSVAMEARQRAFAVRSHRK